MNGQDTRRQRVQELMSENAMDVALMAACLGLEESKLGAMVADDATKPISDALATQMEQTFSKPQGWLSSVGESGISYDLFGE